MATFLDPAILFFAVGILAGCAKSNLEIPAPISRFLAMYLLMALGLKGGFALAKSGLTIGVVSALACAVTLAIAIPIVVFAVLRRRLAPFDAAAVAATYGSVSAVTFVTAVQVLESQGVAYGGHMAAAMALMESPAIVLAVVMANVLRRSGAVAASGGGAGVATLQPGPGVSVGQVLRESFTDGGQILLLGAMAVGILSGEAGKAAMQPFTGELFKGMLAFFLLDMGLLTARSLPGLRERSTWLVGFGVVAPLLHAAAALALARLVGLGTGDTALLMVLAASASYIAVPAVIRHAIPEANPSLYVGLPLGITFPFNIFAGIPLYLAAAKMVTGG
ncbi:MAG: sodium-dependent bicarbonate transport family permease [Burkholderiales bacterium]